MDPDPDRFDPVRSEELNLRDRHREEKYRNKWERAQAALNLLAGFCVGVFVGVAWEVLRRR